MKKYPIMEKEEKRGANYYQFDPVKMRDFLVSKHWWVVL
jgi:hypothetical protein